MHFISFIRQVNIVLFSHSVMEGDNTTRADGECGVRGVEGGKQGRREARQRENGC